MATKSLVVLNKVIFPDQEEDAMLDVPEDGHVEGGTEECANHLIHHFDTNIDAMEKQEQLHPGKITLEVLHIRHFYSLMLVQWLICWCGMCFVTRH